MAAAWKKKINLIRIRSSNPVPLSPVWHHRAKEPYDLLLLIYVTQEDFKTTWFVKSETEVVEVR
jgi:hypothetical protein